MSTKKAKEVRVDNASFNADHAATLTEQQFIDEHMSGVPDNVGDESQKKAYLKEAYGKVVPKDVAVDPKANTVVNQAALDKASAGKGK